LNTKNSSNNKDEVNVAENVTEYIELSASYLSAIYFIEESHEYESIE